MPSAKRTQINQLAKTYSEGSIRYNDYLLEYCQTSMSALSGATAGILGLTGLNGFIFYFIVSLFLSSLILFKLGNDVNRYFISKSQIVTNTLWSGIQTYLLFWTFLFGMVHVYQGVTYIYKVSFFINNFLSNDYDFFNF